MAEPIFKLFGEAAKKLIKALNDGKLLRYKQESIEGRTVVKVYVVEESLSEEDIQRKKEVDDVLK